MIKESGIIQSKNIYLATLLLLAVALIILAPGAAVNVD